MPEPTTPTRPARPAQKTAITDAQIRAAVRLGMSGAQIAYANEQYALDQAVERERRWLGMAPRPVSAPGCAVPDCGTMSCPWPACAKPIVQDHTNGSTR